MLGSNTLSILERLWKLRIHLLMTPTLLCSDEPPTLFSKFDNTIRAVPGCTRCLLIQGRRANTSNQPFNTNLRTLQAYTQIASLRNGQLVVMIGMYNDRRSYTTDKQDLRTLLIEKFRTTCINGSGSEGCAFEYHYPICLSHHVNNASPFSPLFRLQRCLSETKKVSRLTPILNSQQPVSQDPLSIFQNYTSSHIPTASPTLKEKL